MACRSINIAIQFLSTEIKDNGSLFNATFSTVRIDRYCLMYSVSFWVWSETRCRFLKISFQLWSIIAFIKIVFLMSPLPDFDVSVPPTHPIDAVIYEEKLRCSHIADLSIRK